MNLAFWRAPVCQVCKVNLREELVIMIDHKAYCRDCGSSVRKMNADKYWEKVTK